MRKYVWTGIYFRHTAGRRCVHPAAAALASARTLPESSAAAAPSLFRTQWILTNLKLDNGGRKTFIMSLRGGVHRTKGEWNIVGVRGAKVRLFYLSGPAPAL